MHAGIYILIGIWLLPTVLIFMSRPMERTGGWLWVVVTLSFSWLGWVAYAFMVADDQTQAGG